ncbi:prepilin-type N-terminal cleavage/methylation domain-containing protein [Flavobacteriaceae bacterium MHTCC 0001]
MPSPKRIKAFTLSEMIIVLIITSIVVGLAFSTLRLVQKHMQQIQQNFITKSNLNTLEESLWLDFNTYSEIRFDDNKDELKLKTALDSVNYIFTKDKVIRNTDTLSIKIEEKTFFFNGEKVYKGQIDAVKLVASKTAKNSVRFIFKPNAANHFLNYGI